MTWYVARRVGQALVVVVIVSLVTFLVTRVLFPDPVQALMGGPDSTASAQQMEAKRAELGLDQPLFQQYFTWIGSVVQGDLGRSFTTPVDVSAAIMDRLPVTIELTVLALALALILGVSLGVLAAVLRGSWLDTVASSASVLSLSVPNFFLGILLIYVFALNLGWLPSAGYVSFTDDPVENLRLMILPAFTLSLAYVGEFSRYARALMIGVLSEDYVLRAHASGLSTNRVLTRHAMRNTMIPMGTVVGLDAAGLVGGAVVTETVFSLPGTGTLLTDSILGKDFPILQGLILVIAVAVVVINLLIDLAYGLLDPRIKVS